MNKVLILGANGFLGRHLCEYFISEGYEIKTLSRKGDNIDYKIDIGEQAAWKQIDFEPEIIINCIATLPGGNAADEAYVKALFNTNCLGTHNLCKWIEQTGSVRYVLNVSSLSVVSRPWPLPLKEDSATYPSGQHALYSLSKLNQEIILNNYPFSHRVKIAHARLSALFGENMAWNGVMCSIIDKALEQEAINLTNGTNVSFDFIYVKDVCEHFITFVKNESEGVINTASGEEVFLFDLAKMILNITSRNFDDLSNIDTIQEYNRSVVDIRKLKCIDTDFKKTDFLLALKNTIKYRQTV